MLCQQRLGQYWSKWGQSLIPPRIWHCRPPLAHRSDKRRTDTLWSTERLGSRSRQLLPRTPRNNLLYQPLRGLSCPGSSLYLRLDWPDDLSPVHGAGHGHQNFNDPCVLCRSLACIDTRRHSHKLPAMGGLRNPGRLQLELGLHGHWTSSMAFSTGRGFCAGGATSVPHLALS